MPFIVIHRTTDKIVATIDRDDIPTWCALMEIPAKQVSDFQAVPIPNMTILPCKRCKPKEEYW